MFCKSKCDLGSVLVFKLLGHCTALRVRSVTSNHLLALSTAISSWWTGRESRMQLLLLGWCFSARECFYFHSLFEIAWLELMLQHRELLNSITFHRNLSKQKKGDLQVLSVNEDYMLSQVMLMSAEILIGIQRQEPGWESIIMHHLLHLPQLQTKKNRTKLLYMSIL